MPALGVISVVAGARDLTVIAPVPSIDAARIAWRHRVPFEILEIGLRRVVLVKSESPVGGARCLRYESFFTRWDGEGISDRVKVTLLMALLISYQLCP